MVRIELAAVLSGRGLQPCSAAASWRPLSTRSGAAPPPSPRASRSAVGTAHAESCRISSPCCSSYRAPQYCSTRLSTWATIWSCMASTFSCRSVANPLSERSSAPRARSRASSCCSRASNFSCTLSATEPKDSRTRVGPGPDSQLACSGRARAETWQARAETCGVFRTDDPTPDDAKDAAVPPRRSPGRSPRTPSNSWRGWPSSNSSSLTRSCSRAVAMLKNSLGSDIAAA
mmetsp:Transcript_20369/g.53989  ORF Transcript_20369/g.53989 Transcript_20369/m.53989 type:complete len:231 (+) Transcript_20369:1085-1777(+)